MNGPILHQPEPEQPREIWPRAFVLQCNEDETGVSGTGIVAEGVEFSDGTVALYWNYDHHTSDMLRDRIADVLERNADAIGQPYNLADAVLSAMHGWIDRLDRTLYDVIPPGDWGIVLEGDDA